MKTLLTSVLLFGAFAVHAEVITVKLPKAGTYLVTLKKEASCMPIEFTLTPKERGPLEIGNGEYVNAVAAEVVNTWGRAQVCGGFHTATGYFAARANTILKVELNEDLLNPEISVIRIKK